MSTEIRPFEDTMAFDISLDLAIPPAAIPVLEGPHDWDDWEDRVKRLLRFLGVLEFMLYEVTLQDGADEITKARYHHASHICRLLLTATLSFPVVDTMTQAGWSAESYEPWETYVKLREVVFTGGLSATLDKISLKD